VGGENERVSDERVLLLALEKESERVREKE